MATSRSCNAPIMWAVTTDGKKVPLDEDPLLVAVLDKPGDPPVVKFVRARLNHFATCPNAAQHRKGGSANGE